MKKSASDNKKSELPHAIIGMPAKQNYIFLKGSPMLFGVLLSIVFLLASLHPVSGQDCDTEKAVVAKAKLVDAAKADSIKKANAFNNLPAAKPKPADNKDAATTAKTALDASRIKWDKSKDALNDSKKNLKPGNDAVSLQQGIDNKKREVSEKQEALKTRDTKSYNENRSKIAEFEGEFKTTINGFKRNTARELLDNTDYTKIDFSKKVIDKCAGEKSKQHNASEDLVRPECYSEKAAELLKIDRFKSEKITQLRQDLQNAVNASNASGKVSSASKEAPWETISRAGPQLLEVMENTRTDLRTKYTEYVKLDNGIGILQEEINALRVEVKTLEDQLKPIGEAEKKANEAKKEYEEAEKKWKEAEKNVQDIKDWEAANNKRKDVEKEKNDAITAKANADTEKTTADNADAAFKTQATATLNPAQAAAQLTTLDARMATLNRDVLREASNRALANVANVAENKVKFEQALKKPNLTEAQKTEVRRRWGNYFRPIVRPIYIRTRNETEAARLRAIRDDATLQSFKCVKEVNDFIILLDQAINKVMALTASMVSGVDFPDPNEEQVLIPDELIPPLDESSGDDGPTDEIPDDITKNTGQVKVDQYFVFLLTNASHGLYIGTIDGIKTSLRCSFVGGGINCKPTDFVTYKKLLGPYATRAEAQEGLCKSITESRIFPIGVGLKGRWQGGKDWYGLWDVSISDCPPK
jgi:hypothetical protein